MSTQQGSTAADGSADGSTGGRSGGDSSTGRARRAGAFDIRTFIATLIGIYGLVLVVMGLVSSSDSDLTRADGINVNLWAGLGMVVAAAVLIAWAMLRPLVVPPDTGSDSADSRDPVSADHANPDAGRT